MLESTTIPQPRKEQVENISGPGKRDGSSVGNPSRLTIIEIIRHRGQKTQALCLCDCGTVKEIPLHHVKNGFVKSCGCLQRETSRQNGRNNRKHGQTIPGQRGRTYRSWESMKARCLNVHDPYFSSYGGRGITVCDRWRDSFEAFLADMGERPEHTTLDRIDTNGNYIRSNCRWAPPTIQQRNKRSNRLVIYQDELMPLVTLSEKTGRAYGLLFDRIVRYGWTVEDAVNKPRRQRRN